MRGQLHRPFWALTMVAALILMITGATSPEAARGQSDEIGVSGEKGRRKEGIGVDADLSSALASAMPYVISAYAKGFREADLKLSPELSGVLANVRPYVVSAYAKGFRDQPLSFNRELLNDITAPRVERAPRCERKGNQVVVVIEADEFVKVTVRFGTQPGEYTGETPSTPLQRRHEVALGSVGTAQPITYYYRYTMTDLSGNRVESDEQNCAVGAAASNVYLPQVVR